MGNCEKLMEKVFDHVDGLLSSDKKKEIEAHLEQCSACRALFTDAKNIRQQFRGLKPIEASGDFETVLRARIRMEKSLNRRGIFEWPMRLPIYAVAGSLAVITAFFVFTESRNNARINSNQSPFISQTIERSAGSTTSAPTIRQQVRFPMDKVPFADNRGTALDSDELQRSRIDSIRGSIQRSPIQTVEFEF
jgi:hypothetical protein